VSVRTQGKQEEHDVLKQEEFKINNMMFFPENCQRCSMLMTTRAKHTLFAILCNTSDVLLCHGQRSDAKCNDEYRGQRTLIGHGDDTLCWDFRGGVRGYHCGIGDQSRDICKIGANGELMLRGKFGLPHAGVAWYIKALGGSHDPPPACKST
jgi:hypothetical protein